MDRKKQQHSDTARLNCGISWCLVVNVSLCTQFPLYLLFVCDFLLRITFQKLNPFCFEAMLLRQ